MDGLTRQRLPDLEIKYMTFLYRALKIKSITVLALGTVMLFSCKTNMKDVDAIGNRNNMPEMSGENMELFYSDSALLK